MKPRSLIVTGLVLATAVFATGCASYKINPTAASITLPQAKTPIPATVGILQVEQNLQGGFSDIVRPLKQSIDESRLFREIYYPMRPSDQTDGQINLRLSSSFQMDGGLFPKSFFTGFFMFLPAPIITYDHHYTAECRLEFYKGDHLLKTYTAESKVEVVHKLLAPPAEIEKQGTEATIKLLCKNLTTQLINDRAELEKLLIPAAAPTAPAGN